ncbi:hypothetical protein SLA2020_175530 [Shorea laevis]
MQLNLLNVNSCWLSNGNSLSFLVSNSNRHRWPKVGLGADQFDEKDEEDKVQMAYFFNRFFFVISMGTLMAGTVLVYIQDEVSRSWGYGICSASMFVAILIYLSGTKRYRYKKCLRSPIVQICQAFTAAIGKKNAKLPSDIALLYEDLPEAFRILHTVSWTWPPLSQKMMSKMMVPLPSNLGCFVRLQG